MRFAVNGIALVAALAATGCGKSTPVTDSKVSKECVELSKSLGELLAKVRPAAESGDLTPLFAAAGQVPKNPKDYAKYSFDLGQIPSAGGDDCKAIVEICIPNMSDPWDSTWTFKKESGEWKLATAPLVTAPPKVQQTTQDRD